ncbi:tyrosinase family protein [Roseibacterium beibuensis]|uniref:tyrosinase family protein n=1 Tax=[Roseibacterium] beibuensis TaxID=1193142 RepID=UPI00217ED369|nr:tyrosinase family protein [Roseibacterium beibuensis]MCS6627128.1 tyrosinase family protein [Roseibacterium beibuensis]
MRMNRRAALAGGAAAAIVGTGVAGAQTPVRIRKGAGGLTAASEDVAAFGEAVRIMKRRRDALSWERQTQIHHRASQHNNGLFLPWHRHQLAHFERIVAKLTGHDAFAMPYWDWQEHRFLPEWMCDRDSPLYERERARGVETLDFAAARWAESPYTAKLASDGFETFCGKLPEGAGMVEGYGHNHIHQLIGGAMRHPRTSARDPMFWLHHSNVDRVWATWHRNRGKDLYPADWTALTVGGFVDAEGRDVADLPVGGTLETRPLGYDYDRLYPFPVFNVIEQGPPGATRRIPMGGQSWTLRADAARGGRISLTLPDDAVARMREADDTLMIAGEGAVAYARETALEDRSLEIRMTSGSRERTLGSSPTFVHIPEPGDGHHGHRGPYVLPFRFGEEVLNLLAASEGPAAVTVFAEDLAPELARADARAAWIELKLTLTETRWA